MTQLSQSDYERFHNLLLERTGLYFGEGKRLDMAKHLVAAMGEATVSDLDKYYTRLWAAALDDALWIDLIDRLTVGETYFLRNPAHFAALRTHILPPLIQRRPESGHLVLRMWSAGCATGEEPYSLAITLHELLPDIDAWNIMLLATDINRQSLASAVKGIYREHSFRKDTPAAFRDRYLRQIKHDWELEQKVRRMVHFAYLNLAEDSYPSVTSFTVGLDLIICRNVTIYFDRPTTMRMASCFRSALVDDGWLMVGHSEPLNTIYLGFDARNFEGAVVYQKSSESYPVNDRAPAVRRRPLRTHRPPSVSANTTTSVSLSANGAQKRKQAQKPLEQIESADTDKLSVTSAGAAMRQAGKLCADRMQWEEALEWLDRAVKLDPLLLEGPLHASTGAPA